MALLSKGNTKLGPLIYSFSLVAPVTCPGATALCQRFCYARTGRFLLPAVRQAHARRLTASQTNEFVPALVHEIRQNCVNVVRVHVEGDFHTAGYIRQWGAIARRCPKTVFFAYTRSWRVKRLVPGLKDLAALANFRIWWSTDAETGRPNVQELSGAGVAWMATTDRDLPPWPVDLVFRDQARVPMKFTPDGAWVCVYDQGVKRQLRITCSHCAACWRDTRQFPLPRRPARPAPPARLALALVETSHVP